MTIAGAGRPVWEIEEHLKERGIKLAASAAPRESALAKEAALRAWERLGRPISSDDIRAEAPELFRGLPPGKRANFMGSVWDRKTWEFVGYCTSRTPGSHGNLLRRISGTGPSSSRPNEPFYAVLPPLFGIVAIFVSIVWLGIKEAAK